MEYFKDSRVNVEFGIMEDECSIILQRFLICLVPIMIFFILELIMAPLHIIQGSMVTYKSQSVSLQPPNVSDASFIANISACAVLSLRVSVKLWPLPIISLSLTITDDNWFRWKSKRCYSGTSYIWRFEGWIKCVYK